MGDEEEECLPLSRKGRKGGAEEDEDFGWKRRGDKTQSAQRLFRKIRLIRPICLIRLTKHNTPSTHAWHECGGRGSFDSRWRHSVNASGYTCCGYPAVTIYMVSR